MLISINFFVSFWLQNLLDKKLIKFINTACPKGVAGCLGLEGAVAYIAQGVSSSQEVNRDAGGRW